MKKCLTVLLVIAVMFTFSFGSAFAATPTYTSQQYWDELWTNQWESDGAASDKLATVERDYGNALGLVDNVPLFGTTITGEDLGIKAGNAGVHYTESAIKAAQADIRAKAEAAVKKYISTLNETYFSNAANTETNPSTFDITTVTVLSDGTTLAQLLTATGYNTAFWSAEEVAVLGKANADSYRTAVTATVAKVQESDYNDENANAVAQAKVVLNNALGKADNLTDDNARAKAYVEAYAAFETAIGDLPTLDEEDYDDANKDAAIAAAVADFVNYGLTSAYGSFKLVADDPVYSGYTSNAAALDEIYEKISGDKVTIFGVTVNNAKDVTLTEATAVNKAFRQAILDSADVVTAYANTFDKTADAVAAIEALSTKGTDAWEFMRSLNKSVKAVKTYEDVVALGEEYKDAYRYGVKVYNDENVDRAVADAEELVYADLKAGFDTPANYIKEAAKKGGYSIEAENFEYDAFMNAIDDAVAKFFKVNGDPQVKVLYGDNKTAEEDYVYLKGTYATVEAGAWTTIANDAVKAIKIAESYDDINAALETAAADMSELMLAKDEAAVTSAIARYKVALEDDKEAAMDRMGTANYLEDSYTAAFEAGKLLIGAADTLTEVEEAYTEAVALFRTIPTKAELKTAEENVEKLIDDLPTVSSLTADDQAQVVDAFDAYEAYDAMFGAEETNIDNRYTLNAALDTVLAPVGKDIQKRVDDTIKAINRLNPSTDNGAAELVSMEDSIVALIAEAEDFNSLIARINNMDTLGTFNVVTITDVPTLEAQLYAENSIWMAQLHILLADANTSMTSAEKVAVVEAYDQLTDRQKYKLEQNIKTLIESFKAEIISSVEAIKITASSSATKGAMTIKWRVAGDTSGVEAFEIWRSTKKSSGFQKFFTTTDGTKRTYKNTKSLKAGTRYYYKVRGIAYVDGVKIYSDWSNKAYRIAK